MAERDRPHIKITRPAAAEPYTRPPLNIPGAEVAVPADRRGHGARLAGELAAAETEALARREARPEETGRADGILITFESFPGVELALESLDPRQGKVHPELRAVRSVQTAEGILEQATVFIPDGKLGYFLKRLQAYAESADQERPRNRKLVDRIASISVASLEQLWTDAPAEFPEPQTRAWWELWLRRSDGQERERVQRFAAGIEAQLDPRTLAFPDRLVVLIEATAEQLATALDVLNDLAELRRPARTATLLAREPPEEQAAWIAELVERTVSSPDDAPAACVFDTGTNAQHPLLAPSLPADDCHACDPAWGVGDHRGHGTEMAGLALYGTLDEALLGTDEVRLSHRLESVKILPPPPATNPPQLYGAVTATATSLVEIQRPARPRVFSLAVTADGETATDETEPQYGQPTSWSAAIDALAAGLEIDIDDDGLLFLNEDELAGG